MPKPKVLSGEDVIKILSGFGFVPVAQRVKLRRIQSDGERQTLTIPNQKELDRGTQIAIYRQALRYLPEQELRPHFYAD